MRFESGVVVTMRRAAAREGPSRRPRRRETAAPAPHGAEINGAAFVWNGGPFSAACFGEWSACLRAARRHRGAKRDLDIVTVAPGYWPRCIFSILNDWCATRGDAPRFRWALAAGLFGATAEEMCSDVPDRSVELFGADRGLALIAARFGPHAFLAERQRLDPVSRRLIINRPDHQCVPFSDALMWRACLAFDDGVRRAFLRWTDRLAPAERSMCAEDARAYVELRLCEEQVDSALGLRWLGQRFAFTLDEKVKCLARVGRQNVTEKTARFVEEFDAGPSRRIAAQCLRLAAEAGPAVAARLLAYAARLEAAGFVD
jgi:hypothetical protein